MNPTTERLLNAWIEGELTPAEEEALTQLLSQDPEARAACYDLMLLDQLLEEREESFVPLGTVAAASSRTRMTSPGWKIAAAAALLALAGVLWHFHGQRGDQAKPRVSPSIIASSDSRITIAQREHRGDWAPGELLRLERGTAAIETRTGVLAHFEGPAAIELADRHGNLKMLEGRASFQVADKGRTFEIEAPGGLLRAARATFACQILPDQAMLVEVNAGSLEIVARDRQFRARIDEGQAVRLAGDGAVSPTARPAMPFRAGLPEEFVLFHDNFAMVEDTPLAAHRPGVGRQWRVLAEPEPHPSFVRNHRLDTSAGAREWIAGLAPHDPGGSGSVYVFSFSLLPPSWSHDKVQRMDGVESIAFLDADQKEIFAITAAATNTHRWQLAGGSQVSPLTPVCALWEHQLTVCYGLDGRVTLHDGGTAQSPVIASIWLQDPAAVDAMRISNRTGGDLAFRWISAALLKAPPLRAE
jgi:hypothetical protein